MIKLYNTATGKIEDFEPINQNQVLFYSCGPTVYDNPHIGNWYSYIYWDVLVRLLKFCSFDVKRVINITDVGHLVSDGDDGEDKLEKGAKRENKTAWDIAKKYTEVFIDGFEKLNLIKPTFMPRVTDFIPQQIEMIRKLHEKGFTYQIDDGIYFDTSKFKDYAKFAKLDLENLMAGARVEYNSQKRNPSDFAVWKFSPINEKRDMEWETPKDILDYLISTDYQLPIMGFPGWHIECSAIASNLLGETIDIHTGGIDAIPVHHTNEIAQSESASGKKFSNYWLHCNFLQVDGKKMSKSLGNCYTLEEIVNHGYSPMDLRMLVLQGNFRNQSNFTFENLNSARIRLKNWKNIAALRHQIHNTLVSSKEQLDNRHVVSIDWLTNKIIEALELNLNTAEALKHIDEAFTQISGARLDLINRQSLIEALENIDELLGLNLLNSTKDISDEQKRLIMQRTNARLNRDWKESDRIRDELIKAGISIKDNDQNKCIWQYV